MFPAMMSAIGTTFGGASIGSALGSAGGFLSGASSFLGGLGIGGGKQKRPKPSETSQMIIGSRTFTPELAAAATALGFQVTEGSYIQPNVAQALADHYSIRSRKASAEMNGLHPLSVLGLPSYTGPSTYMDGAPSKGIDLNAMGQGVDRMANAGRSNIQRQLDNLALEQAQLSNDYLRVQIAGAQKAIANSGATISMDGADLSGNFSPKSSLTARDLIQLVKDQQTTKNPSDSGKTAGNHAGFMTVDLGNGYSTELPKSDDWAESLGEMPILYKYGKLAEILAKRIGSKHHDKIHGKKYSKKWLAPWDPRRWKNSKEK